MRGFDISATTEPGAATFWPGLRTVWVASRNHPTAAAVAAVVGIVNGIAMILGAVAVGWSTDHLVIPALAGEQVDTSVWWWSAAAILGVSAARWSTIFVRGLATGIVQHAAQASTRRHLIGQYLRLDLGWHRRHPPGRVMANTIADVDALWFAIVFAYFALGMVVMLGIALVQLFWRHAGLGLVAALMIIGALVINIAYQRALSPRAQRVQRARSEVSRVAQESIDGTQVVRTLGLREREAARFGAANDDLRDAATQLGRVAARFEPFVELLPAAAVLGVLWVGMRQVEQGGLTHGVVVEVVYLLLTVTIPLSVISRFVAMLPTSAAGRVRVDEVLDAREFQSAGSRRIDTSAPPELRLSGAGLRHGGTTLLHGIDLVVRPGEVLAVVGGTGSGKSTLLELLAGLRAPSTGRFTVDGVESTSLATGQLAELIGYVSQNTFLFAGTVRENLELAGHPTRHRPYAEAELWSALRLAAADDFVRELPDGLDTVLGERGSSISGGQRQRLSLARALVREPAVLLLDDATSALDTEVESRVLAALREIGAGTDGPATVIVANRLSSIELADRVAVLRAGRIVAAGTADELLETSAEYRAIVQAYEHQREERHGAGPID